MLEDNGGHDSPLLPSLTVLVLVGNIGSLYRPPDHLMILYDALMKRVEQGVPLETLDLRMCVFIPVGYRLLSEIVADVLVPETDEEEGRMSSMWDSVCRDLFVVDYDSWEEEEEEEEED